VPLSKCVTHQDELVGLAQTEEHYSLAIWGTLWDAHYGMHSKSTLELLKICNGVFRGETNGKERERAR